MSDRNGHSSLYLFISIWNMSRNVTSEYNILWCSHTYLFTMFCQLCHTTKHYCQTQLWYTLNKCVSFLSYHKALLWSTCMVYSEQNMPIFVSETPFRFLTWLGITQCGKLHAWILQWCTEAGKSAELLAFSSWLKFLYEKLCLLQIYDRDPKDFAAHYQEMLQSEKQQGEKQKEMGSDMQFWRLLHDKHMPWPCIVNSLKKDFANTCLSFSFW